MILWYRKFYFVISQNWICDIKISSLFVIPQNRFFLISLIRFIDITKLIYINALQQTACLVVNPITVGNFAFLFNCTPVGRTSDSMMDPT